MLNIYALRFATLVAEARGFISARVAAVHGPESLSFTSFFFMSSTRMFYRRFEILTEVKIPTLVFWAVTPC
jgi:hypothetical protein